MDIPHDLSGRVEATCKWLESGTSVFTTDMAHDIRARIAELEASLADESARVEEFRSTLAETRKQRDAILARAEQAEAILLGEDVTVAAYRNMQAALAEAQVRAAGWELSWQKADKAAEQAEAECEAIAQSLRACGNYTGYTMYVEQRDRADKAEAALERARTYKGIEAYACPLCEYRDGIFIKSCQMHEDMHDLERRWREAEEFAAMSHPDAWKRVAQLTASENRKDNALKQAEAARDAYSRSLDKTRAELAVLEGRRCVSCHHSRKHGKLCFLFDVYFPAGFACNRFTARAEEGGGIDEDAPICPECHVSDVMGTGTKHLRRCSRAEEGSES